MRDRTRRRSLVDEGVRAEFGASTKREVRIAYGDEGQTCRAQLKANGAGWEQSSRLERGKEGTREGGKASAAVVTDSAYWSSTKALTWSERSVCMTGVSRGVEWLPSRETLQSTASSWRSGVLHHESAMKHLTNGAACASCAAKPIQPADRHP